MIYKLLIIIDLYLLPIAILIGWLLLNLFNIKLLQTTFHVNSGFPLFKAVGCGGHDNFPFGSGLDLYYYRGQAAKSFDGVAVERREASRVSRINGHDLSWTFDTEFQFIGSSGSENTLLVGQIGIDVLQVTFTEAFLKSQLDLLDGAGGLDGL